MKGQKSKFESSAVYHYYQRASDHGIIFYTVEDRIVFYTLASVKSKQFNVTVLGVAIMFSHVHQALKAKSSLFIDKYLQTLNSSFSRLYNHHYKRRGKLFERRPGHSKKVSIKAQKSNLIYIFNNHVEKGLAKTAIESRWSFLPYAISSNPFSNTQKQESRELKKAISLIERRVRQNKSLEYCDLDQKFKNLSYDEKQVFVDTVISKYGLIDFTQTLNRFGSFELMNLAVNSTTGGEYDIKEDIYRESDVAFLQMSQKFRPILSDIYNISGDYAAQLMIDALNYTTATPSQARRFFHQNN